MKNYEATEKNEDRNDFHNLYFLCSSFVFSTPQSHEIHDLEIYTQYLITIQVFNPEGLGPATSVVCMTDEGGE
jgi:hypothetical protein